MGVWSRAEGVAMYHHADLLSECAIQLHKTQSNHTRFIFRDPITKLLLPGSAEFGEGVELHECVKWPDLRKHNERKP